MITAKLILTGKETYDPEYPTVSKHDALEAMIEFAKLHVTEALKVASEKAKNCHIDELIDNEVLKSYPLENIK